MTSPNSDLNAELAARLEQLDQHHRRRRLRRLESEADFLSNDYLGLSRHPELVVAIERELRAHGAGGRASRLLAGGSASHERAERLSAEWLGAEAGLLFPSGYQANVGLLQGLAERGDALFSDALCHASLIDGARLSRASVQVHRHFDLEELDWRLSRSGAARRRWVLTEGVFSMDGDLAPIAELLELCDRHDASLIVDEAHSVGLLGDHGAGAVSAAASAGADLSRLAARLVAGGKALGVGGACVVSSGVVRDWLINRSRAFIFSTAPPTALPAGFARAIELAAEAREERRRCLANAAIIARSVDAPEPAAAIVPWILGSDADALEAAADLERAGIAALAVRPPTVPEGTSRVRLVANADQSRGDLERLGRAVDGVRRSLLSGREARAECTPGAQAPLSPRSPSHHSEAALAETPPPKATAPVDSPSTTTAEALAPVVVVVGTDTGIGKTVSSAALLRAALNRGPARYWKPVQTGDDDDTREVGRLSGAPPEALAGPVRHFPLPASPHEAAAAAGEEITVAQLDERLLELRVASATPLLIELAGGLLVPYRLDASQADWLQNHGLEVVLIARSGLGTLNHTSLTLEALRQRKLRIRGLLLVGEPHPSNRDTLARLNPGLAIFELPILGEADQAPTADHITAWVAGQELNALLP